ncbi:hypothetical protein GCM10010515_67020 [Streptomyces fructofermentans]|uniref:Uncharacterized protein n=1 Tax=Streptomyces fructofermentans TaxID=152141 RepID=A0A918NRL6_9ACTN|nr:hypothetical protein GCM10010515_67020 [Streptomyces fructofermentans]
MRTPSGSRSVFPSIRTVPSAIRHSPLSFRSLLPRLLFQLRSPSPQVPLVAAVTGAVARPPGVQRRHPATPRADVTPHHDRRGRNGSAASG